MSSNSMFPYIGGSNITEFTREELFEVDRTLELEYLGGNVSLDTVNITGLSKGNSTVKLTRFALHTNIVKPIIDKENTTYINPPTRTFTTKNGGKISKRVEERLTELYEETKFDLMMARAEKYASLLGTVLYKPVFDADDGTMDITEIFPSNASLTLIPHPKFPGKVMAVTYKYTSSKIEYTVYTDKDKTVVTWTDENNQDHEDIDEHRFGVLPFAILNFSIDKTRQYGPPDYELYSLCKHRSLVLANAMARMHLSDLEKLLLTGTDLPTAMANMKGQIMALPSTMDSEGKTVTPTAQYISPDGQDALNLLEAYFKLYNHIMDNRGHVQKIFSRGSDVPSAESIRLGSVDLFNKQQEKKKFLTLNEKALFLRLIKENNRFSGNTQIPEDTQLMVNYKPEPMAFSSASDEVTYFNAAIVADVKTPVDWIMNGDRELTEVEATALYEMKKKFNDENKENIINIINEPVVPAEEGPLNDGQDSINQL